MKQLSRFRTISKVLLAGLLTVSIQAQQADALKITVTQGVPPDPAAAKAAKKHEPVPAPVIVEVRDDSGRIVPGARVQINTPASAGKPLLGWTDTQGLAYIDGVIPPGQEGQGSDHRRCALQAANSEVLLSTTTPCCLRPPEITRTFTFNKPNHKVRDTWIIVGIVGATALAVALALTLPGGSSHAIIPVTTTTVSIGGTTVGAPQ